MKENTKHYHLSDAALLNECRHLINCMNRDSSDFEKRNIMPHHRQSFENLMWQFYDLPTDEEIEDAIMAAVENKNGIADLIFRDIHTLHRMAGRQWKNAGHYHAFGFENTSAVAEEDVLLMVKRVVRVSKRFMNELAPQGLTEELLTELIVLGKQFSDAVNWQKATIDDSVVTCRERVMLGNELYTRLVGFTNIGKAMYEYANEDKYNDYTLRSHEAAASPYSQTA